MPKCSEVMTADPVACEPTESVRAVARVMKQHDVGSVPVVEAVGTKRLSGIVTDRDIVVKVIAEGRDADQATVREAMTASPAVCRMDDDVEKAVKLMAERQVRRVPVVDESGRLRGIIAQADIATRVNQDKTTGELVEAISEGGTSRR